MLNDYKIHCFNGEPKFIQIIGDRDIAAKQAYQRIYDFDWKDTGWPFGTYPRYDHEIARPRLYPPPEEISRRDDDASLFSCIFHNDKDVLFAFFRLLL